jgi:hypothetical protein
VTTSRENNNSYVAGRFVAANYGRWYTFALSVPRNVTGSHTFTVENPLVNLPDGRNFLPFATNAPIVFGAETITPSAVAYSDNNSRCTITATFTVPHSQNDPISSATIGLQEAINDAAGLGGIVTVDGQWSEQGGTTLMITDAVVPGNVEIEDVRTGLPPSAGFALTTIGSSGPATLAAGTLNVPEYQGGLTLTTEGTSGDATLVDNTLNIPDYSGGSSLDLTTTGTSGPATLVSDTLNVPEYQGALDLTTTGDSGAATLVDNTLNIPEYQGALDLTTTGTSGPASLSGDTLNIPQYSGGGGGGALVNITDDITWTGGSASGGVFTSSGSASSIEASDIPAGYNSLIFIMSGMSSIANGFMAQFNGDTAAHYAVQGVSTSGTTAVANNGNDTQTSIQFAAYMAPAGSANKFEIPFYAGSNPKVMLIDSGNFSSVSSSTTNFSNKNVALWSGVAAITEILLTANTGNVVDGFNISVYGVQ